METRKENVLIVAGGESDRKVLTRYLEEAGYQVTPASNGQQGFELVKTLKPEVVLLDLHVTELDASEIVQSIASDDTLRIIPVIVLATPAEMEAVERCLALPA